MFFELKDGSIININKISILTKYTTDICCNEQNNISIDSCIVVVGAYKKIIDEDDFNEIKKLLIIVDGVKNENAI